MEYKFPRIIVFLFSLLTPFTSSKFEVQKTFLTKVSQKANGAFRKSDSAIAVFINNNVYDIDLENNITKSSPVEISTMYLSMNLVSVPDTDLMIIGCGEYLLYFVDSQYNKIGSEVPFAEPDVKERIVGTSVLDYYENKLILLYGETTEDEYYQIRFSMYDVDINEHKFVSKGSFIAHEYDVDTDTNTFDCIFAESGSDVVCAFRDDFLETFLGFVEDNSNFNYNSTELLSIIIKLVKLSENTFFLCTVLEEITLQIYSVLDKKLNKIASAAIDGYTTFELSNFIKKDERSIIITDFIYESGKIKIHIATYYGSSDIFVSSFYFSEASLDQVKMNILSENKIFLMTRFDNTDFYSFSFEIPVCKEISNKLYSEEKITFSGSDLSPDYPLVKPNEVFCSEGSVVITSNDEIEFRPTSLSSFIIYYTVIETVSNTFTSGFCKIEGQVCNKACESCKRFSLESSDTQCIKCSKNYYPLEDDDSKCYNRNAIVKGYYFNTIEEKFSPCFYKCETCAGEGSENNHNCLSCKEGYSYDSNTLRCTCDTQKNIWFEKDGEAVCVVSCFEEYPYFVKEIKKCVKDCSEEEPYKKKFGYNCVQNCPEDNIEINDTCIKNTNIFSIINLNISEIFKKYPTGSYKNESSVSTYEIYENIQQKSTKFTNSSTIDFQQCEKTIKKYYHVDSFLVFKVDIARKAQITNQVEYLVFSTKGEKIDLSVCKDDTILVRTPIYEEKLEDISFSRARMFYELGYDIYNLDDNFYTDVCAPYTTEKGNDLPLEDRVKNEYLSFPFCETNCSLQGIDFDNNEAKCYCKIKVGFSEEDKGFNATSSSSYKKRNNLNLRVLKCAKAIFVPKIPTNIGFWIALASILIEVGCLVAYAMTGTKPFLRTLSNLFPAKLKNGITEPNPSLAITVSKNQTNSAFTEGSNLIKSAEVSKDKEIKSNTLNLRDGRLRLVNSIAKSREKIYPTFNIQASQKSMNFSNSKSYLGQDKHKLNTLNTGSLVPLEEVTKDFRQSTACNSSLFFTVYPMVPPIKPLKMQLSKEYVTTSEIDFLNFQRNTEMMQESFGKLYLRFLKQKQTILFTFFRNSDDNLQNLKVSLLFFYFSACFGFNTLFYFDSIFYHNFWNNGRRNFLYHIPKIIYSSLCSSVVIAFLKCLSMSEGNIKVIKKAWIRERAKKMAVKFIKVFRVRVITFFILEFILLFFFWYHVCCFCAVFVNTQQMLIVDSITSFLICMGFPFISCLLTAFFRWLSFKKESKFLFLVSQIFFLF